MPVLILFCAVVIFSCILVNKFSNKIGLPSLLFFILLGMLFKSVFPFDNYGLTSRLSLFALIFIIFYGGFCTKTVKNKMLNFQAVLLSSFGTVLTALFCFAFCYYILKIPPAESFLIGAVLSSTDAASVFSILRSKKLNLKYNTAGLLEIESGSNDPFACMLTILGIAFLNGAPALKLVPILFCQIGYGTFFGIITAFFGIFIFKKTNLIQQDNGALFVTALALASFAIPEIIGGNGYLSVYLTGIILGNSKIKNKIDLFHFFDSLTGLCQIAIFFTLGFLSVPGCFLKIFLPAISVVLFLTFFARPAAVFMLMAPFGAKLNQILFVSMAGLRGAASIVFAILVVSQNHILKIDLFHTVFFTAIFSVALNGYLLSYLAKKLNMIDKFSNVMKTFNDYQQESAITLSKIFIKNNHPWINEKIKDIKLHKGTIILLIYRNGCKLIPKENTIILKNDLILMGKTVTKSHSKIELKETEIVPIHEWKNKKIKEVNADGFLIALIKRGENSFVPNNDTKILNGDTVIFYAVNKKPPF